MDEILIEEKRYVSSKRAAKMTGYAKDYIGQLCREGRVPARLIGRSWYVLEAAIQDHRFGSASEESPRYETVSEKETALPTEQREEEQEEQEEQEENESPEPMVTPQSIQDSWKEWFERFDSAVEDETQKEIEVEDAEEPVKVTVAEEEEVNVPIHTVSRSRYQPPPEELLPRHMAVASEEPSERSTRRKKTNRGVLVAIQLVGAVLAVVTAGVAVIGSGYFDTYVISFEPAGMVAGVVLYNK